MALVIEDGSGRSDSNSYASVAELKAYAQLRSTSVPAKDSECEVLLIKAMDAIESKCFVGDKRFKAQALQWPRLNAYVENWPINPTEIPRQLIQAQCALAIEAQTTDLLPTTPAGASGPVTGKRVGDISITYANPGSVRRTPAVAKADVLLRTLLKHSGLVGVRV